MTATVPADDDIISDICALAWINGVVKIPDGHETTGNDVGKRHADAAIAAMLMEHAADAEPVAVEIQTAGDRMPETAGYVDQAPQADRSDTAGTGWGTVRTDVNFEEFGA